MNLRVLKIGLVGGAVLCSAAIYKAYDYISGNTEIKRKVKHLSTEHLTRTHIFQDGQLRVSHLRPLIVHQKINNKAKLKIDESKLETTLRPFIREHLKKIFDSKGWNFEDLSGKIYYFITGTKIEIYVLWKNNKYAASHTDYDRFSINF